MFEIEFTPEAEQDLKWFRKNEQNVILDGIEAQLRYEPTVETRNFVTSRWLRHATESNCAPIKRQNGN
jgi:mRNA-degrading endonuclease RelE of RelBE toxin-antitoxin system